MFKEIEHTADLALEVKTESIEHLFEDSARGMFFLMYGKRNKDKEKTKKVKLKSFSFENLLIDFLNEIIYINETDDFILNDVRVDIKANKNNKLQATLYGYKGNKKKTSIKAATYHDLEIIEKDNAYQTKITFDV